MKDQDPDMKSPTQGDKDLSLNYKSSAVAAAPTKDDVLKAVKDVKSFLGDVSSSLGDSFSTRAESSYVEPMMAGWHDDDSLKEDLETLRKIPSDSRKLSRGILNSLRGADADEVGEIVASAWPNNGPSDWARRAAVISAVTAAIEDENVPESVKIPILHGNSKDPILDKRLLRRLAKPPSKNRDVDADVLAKLSALSSALRTVRQNPSSVDAKKISSSAKAFSGDLKKRISDIQELEEIMDSWFSAMSSLKREKGGVRELSGTKDLNKVVNDLESFLDDTKSVDPGSYMKELEKYSKSKFRDLPPEVEGMFEGFRRAATSNEGARVRVMAARLASYHGVLDQRGNPTDPPNTDYRSYPSRWFDDRHYDSIVKHAKSLLEEDWLKYGWDGGAEDVPLRAALDLSIHLADSSLYQSKIDTETYNMLLNRLAGWGHDTFSETVLPMKAGKRSAADMMQKSREYQNLVRIASDLRQTDPKSALEIMKSIRSMVSTEATSQTAREHVALEPMPPEGHEEHHDEGPEGHEGGEMSEHGMGDGAPEAETAAAPGDVIEMSSMSDEDIGKLKSLSDKFKGEAEKFLDAHDVERLMQGFEDMFSEAKTAASISRVPLNALIRAAASSPVAKTVLGPFIIAAAKKDKKKGKGKPKGKDKPKDKKEDKKGKKPDMGGKAAPPFMKKKASVAFTQEDASW